MMYQTGMFQMLFCFTDVVDFNQFLSLSIIILHELDEFDTIKLYYILEIMNHFCFKLIIFSNEANFFLKN